MRRKRSGKRYAAFVLLLLYLGLLTYFTMFSEALGRTDGGDYRYNLVLFREISRYVKYREQIGWYGFFLNTFGNVLAFMPLGFLFPYVVGRDFTIPQMVLAGALCSYTVELIQLMTRTGSFDVDDIFLNTVGAVLGWGLFLALRRAWRSRKNASVREITEGV